MRIALKADQATKLHWSSLNKSISAIVLMEEPWDTLRRLAAVFDVLQMLEAVKTSNSINAMVRRMDSLLKSEDSFQTEQASLFLLGQLRDDIGMPTNEALQRAMDFLREIYRSKRGMRYVEGFPEKQQALNEFKHREKLHLVSRTC